MESRLFRVLAGIALAFALTPVSLEAQVLSPRTAVQKNPRRTPLHFSMGPEETVFEVPLQACPASDFVDLPDVAARALRMSDGNILLVSGNSRGNFNMRGPTFDSLTRDCTPPPFDSNYNTLPSRFDYQHWIGAVYRDPKSTRIHALVHNEYHDTVHVPPCTPTNSPCIWTSITYAYSDDNAETFVQPGVIPRVVAALPYPWDAYRATIPGVRIPKQHGYWLGSNILKAPDGFYYVVTSLVGDPLNLLGSSHNCMMRTTDLGDTSTWRFWDGTDFNHQTLNPYVNGVTYETALANPETYFASSVDPNLDKMWLASSITWNTYLQAYMLVGGRGNPTLGTPCGIYYSLSTDLLEWTPPVRFREANVPSCGGYEDEAWSVYASVIDHDDPGVNFENADDTFYLYFVNYQTGTDRDLVRVPVTISTE